MKKALLCLLAVTVVFSATACGNEKTDDANAGVSNEASSEASVEQTASYEITDKRVATWVNSIGTTHMQIIVEITNTGTKNLYLDSGSCDIEDASGKLITSESLVSAFPDVLAPGEKGYMYEETILDKAFDGELTVIPHEEVEEAKVDLIRFPVTDTEISNGKYGGFDMLGRVENTSDEEQDLVYVVAFLYDESGTCIGQMFTITDEISAGDKVGFEMSSLSLPDSIVADDIADYVVYAYPCQFQF